MKTDEEFRDRVTDAETAEARKAIVEAEGFDFTKDLIERVKGELGVEELEQVAGGICWTDYPCRGGKCGRGDIVG